MKALIPVGVVKHTCHICKGSGVIYSDTTTTATAPVPKCPACSGTGYIVANQYREVDFVTGMK